MKRVLVTGATGFIGYEVTRQLVQSGLRPRVLVRRPLRGGLFSTWDVETVCGDLESVNSLERAVDGMDTVLHLGARATFEDYVLLRPTIVDGSVALMEAAARSGVEAFVHASSLLVYDSQPNPIDRETRPTPVLGYGRAKLESEDRLREIAVRRDVALSCLRLPHVYGARDLIFDQIRRGRAVFPGSGKNLYAHIHVEDAARVLIRLADKRWCGETPVADSSPASWNEFFDVVRRFYPRFHLLRIPTPLAILGTSVLQRLRLSRARPFLFTPDAVRGSNLELPVASNLLWPELGMEPRYPTIHQGVPAALDECVAFRWLHPLADKSRG